MDANANADAGGSTIALHERCSGELKIRFADLKYLKIFVHLEFMTFDKLMEYSSDGRQIQRSYRTFQKRVLHEAAAAGWSCMNHVMTKPAFAICEQQRHRSACTSAQSNQRLRFLLPRQGNTFTC